MNKIRLGITIEQYEDAWNEAFHNLVYSNIPEEQLPEGEVIRQLVNILLEDIDNVARTDWHRVVSARYVRAEDKSLEPIWIGTKEFDREADMVFFKLRYSDDFIIERINT